ncbi:MAG: hypothetical protein HGA96_14520 [Desulfobulbaceae bacterium]|nr:hypothetical protein [Desulfobulbaceae bacterium]
MARRDWQRDGTPVWIDGDAATLLAKIPYEAGAANGFDEAWMQKCLFDHPSCLPMDRIEKGFRPLRSICRELPTNHGPIDNLFMTGDGDIVIVEVKLWRNPEARRKVVAQALDYASCLFEMNYEMFEKAVLKANMGRAQKPSSLYALFGDDNEVLDEHDFIDAVSRNLSRGSIVVLVVGDGIRSETEQLTATLQSHAGLRFTFALIEMSVYVAPGKGGWLLVPRTLAQTRVIERGVVRFEDGRLTVSSPVAQTSVKHVTAAPSGGSITEEQFYEAMRSRAADLPEKLKAFLLRLESLGVYPEFRRALNLKVDLPSGKTLNLGTIQRDGQVYTDTSNNPALQPIGDEYNEALASAWGGILDPPAIGRVMRYVRVNGKIPRIEQIADRFESWLGPVERLIIAVQTRDNEAE